MTLVASGPIGIGTALGANRNIAAEFGLANNAAFPSAFYGKGGAPASGALTFADFYGRSAAVLTAVAAPDSLYGQTSFGTAFSNATTCTASNGTPAYTYSWSQLSGDTINIDNPFSATTTFSAFLSPGQTVSGSFRCTVTDAAAQVAASNDVFVYLERV